MARIDCDTGGAPEWHRYYSAKRIAHQWMQLDLIGRHHKGGEILEIGPYLGLVTACLVNAGYPVTTLDVTPRQFAWPATPHLCADIRGLDPAQIAAFDTVLCCETLEHLPWKDVAAVLGSLRRDGRQLIVSVPYEGFQIFAQFYICGHAVRQMFQWRKLRAWRRFHVADSAGWEAHKWEVGYRGHSLAQWEAKMREAG